VQIEALKEFCDFDASRFAFRATIFTSPTCKGFVGYGDAHPSNVSSAVHRAEMRVAETRAVNRALRKAYGIGICSVEEIGSFAEPQVFRESKKLPPQPANGNPSEGPIHLLGGGTQSNASRCTFLPRPPADCPGLRVKVRPSGRREQSRRAGAGKLR